MKSILFLLLFVVVSCGDKNLLGINFGKTSKSELIAYKGEPLSESSVPIKDTVILTYDKNEKYQVQDGHVTHLIRVPQGDETSLLYWKHKFKNCKTNKVQINKPVGHESPEFQLSCFEMGFAVVYENNNETILKVIEFEKK